MSPKYGNVWNVQVDELLKTSMVVSTVNLCVVLSHVCQHQYLKILTNNVMDYEW